MDHQKSSLGQTTKQPSMMKTQNDNNSTTMLKDLSCYKLKSPSTWHFGKTGVGDLAAFQWPPRSYTCSFCKREFRSAQALGGHMNVHRRDRARLNNASPVRDGNYGQFPLLNLNLDHNPSFACHYPKCPRLPQFFAHSPANADEMKFVRPSPSLDLRKVPFEKLDKKEVEFVRLDLEIGLIDDKSYGAEKELDLELRLGYC